MTSIAHYRLTAKIGEGGMGAVYRATDTKLNREVAIKILPDSFASDPDRLGRFARESQVLASLNHPNIAAIYGVEDRAIVMELVEGETLRTPLPLDEALPVARQIAEALEYAHERGIVHRDLKPANIKVTSDGRVKVLDFGLAAVAQAYGGEPAAPLSSPTLTMRATQVGVILGTAAYMSPEQAKGKPVDRRADIWAFGCVLYELLTGRMAFAGEGISETLAAVIKDAPDFSALPESTPIAIRRLLRRCLEKDPRRRLQAIGDARIVLEEPTEEAAALAAPVALPPPRRATLPWALAGAFALLFAAASPLIWIHWREAPPSRPMVRFNIAPPDKGRFGSWMSLSPDGRQLAFLGVGAEGSTRLFVRSLDNLETRPIFESDSVFSYFCWSPDSRFLLFQVAGTLKKIDVSGGPAQSLCDINGTLLGGSWNRDGVILFATNTGPVLRVPAIGGTPVAVTKIEPSRGEASHLDPTFLPDRRHFIYYRRSGAEHSGVYLGSLDVKPEQQSLKRLQETEFSPGYAPSQSGGPGYLLFQREGSLMAQAFDERRLETIGDAFPVGVQVGSSLTRSFFSASWNGVLAYRGGGGANSQMAWYDRKGNRSPAAGEPADYQDVALSPDASHLAYSLPTRETGRQLWILDLVRGSNARLSFTTEGARAPAWSPDGKRVAFGSYRSAETGLFIQNADHSGIETVLWRSLSIKYLNDWSRDGRYLLFTGYSAGTGADLLVLPAAGAGESKPVPFANTRYNEIQGQFSPDSRWVAYSSDETGTYEIYIRPFPPDDRRGGKVLVSSAGGLQPRWRGDGKELFYVTPGGKLTAVDIRTEPSVQPGAPHVLFESRVSGSAPFFRYDVTRDGKRFLIVNPALESTSAPVPITVVLNWQEGLKR
jgi:serine/threonine protein kinase/Tol biopolymer transport system component